MLYYKYNNRLIVAKTKQEILQKIDYTVLPESWQEEWEIKQQAGQLINIQNTPNISYFAYGLHADHQLFQLVYKDCICMGHGYLPNYKWGSNVKGCPAISAITKGETYPINKVYGLIYKVSYKDKELLDYKAKNDRLHGVYLDVTTPYETLPCLVYICHGESCLPAGKVTPNIKRAMQRILHQMDIPSYTQAMEQALTTTQ